MKRLKWAAFLLVGVVFMQVTGMGPGDLWTMAVARVTKATDDTQALASGEYSARVASAYREEVDRIPPPAANLGKDDKMLQTELAEARQKLLDDRAAALEKHAGAIMRGDLEGLKRQAAENAKNADGGI